MGVVAGIGYVLVLLFIIAMLVRLVFDWVQVASREWRPSGASLLLAEVVYTVTDPPLKALRAVIPPLRIGGIALDLAFLIVMIAASILLRILAALAT